MCPSRLNVGACAGQAMEELEQEKKVSMQEGVQGAHGSSWKKENWAKNKDRTPLIGQV